MSLSWNTLRAMPRLTNYADAVKYEASVKPIRGREPETKPLGLRNQYWNSIKRDGDDVVVCMQSGNSILRYRPNGDVVIYESQWWNKATFNEIVGTVMGLRLETFDGKAWVYTVEGANHLHKSPKRRYNYETHRWENNTLPPKENILRRAEDGRGWSFVNPPSNVVHHIKRKEMARVTQTYAAFIAYATAMDSLRDGQHTKPEDYAEPFGVKPYTPLGRQPYYTWWCDGMPPKPKEFKFAHKDAAELTGLMLSSDAAANYKAYLWLRVNESMVTSSESLAKRVITMQHHKEVLKEVEVGKAVKDRYAWAIPKGEHIA